MSARRLLAAPALAALAALGCAGDEPAGDRSPRAATRTVPAAGAAARHPLCTRLRARITGRVRSPAATELSGLVASRSQPRVLWSHNDSGDRARILALAPSGRLLADVALPGAAHLDWEDIAAGPARGRRAALYVGDIGDNDEERPEVVVYRVPEPRVGARRPITAPPLRRLALRYPDRPHDAEALLVDPANGALVVVTKDFGGRAGVYVARAAGGTMRRAGRVSLGAGQAVTAGDVSGDGRTVVLRTYDGAFVWSRRRDQSVASALRRRPCAARAGLLSEGQGEALALTRDGRAFLTVPEGRRPPLRRYAPVR